MRLSIRHTTRYEFESPVAHALQRLRLTPKSTQGQRIVAWKMGFENARQELAYEDHNCNAVALVTLLEGATSVTVTCEGIVETADRSGILGSHSGHLPLWSFLAQTPLTRPGNATRALLREIAPTKGGNQIEMLHALSATIADWVRYTPGVTTSRTTAEEALTQGCGVCQDHAQIFIGAAREVGIPSRYVSGYLMMDDRVDQDATHAWAEAHVDGLGWVGFDISNGISPDARYVRVATGRDYGEAAPVTGISFGASSEKLEVRVAVAQQQQ